LTAPRLFAALDQQHPQAQIVQRPGYREQGDVNRHARARPLVAMFPVLHVQVPQAVDLYSDCLTWDLLAESC
jgi:hypothetical protein